MSAPNLTGSTTVTNCSCSTYDRTLLVTHIVLDAERRQLGVVGWRLRQDDGCQLEPPEAVHELKEMTSQEILRRPRREQRRRGVEHNGLRSGLLDQMLEAGNPPIEVVITADERRFVQRPHHLRDMDEALGAKRGQMKPRASAGGGQDPPGVSIPVTNCFQAVLA